MKLIEILTPDFNFTDERGTLTQLVHGGYTQINVVYSKKNAVRGNLHYHEKTKEVFYIIKGTAEIYVKYEDNEETYIFSDGDMFMIPEYVRHTFNYLDDTYILAMYTNPVEKEDGTKDIISDR